MRLANSAATFITAIILSAAPALGWGPEGHETVGAIADRLLAGTDAKKHVQAILGGLTLEQASVWADCVKGVEPSQNYNYLSEGKYPECTTFETPQGEMEMEDFVRRNDRNCQLKAGQDSCHDEYHFTDVAIQRGKYEPQYQGARPDDVVHAVGAAVMVLQGKPAPPPFNFKGKREALMLLTHYVGDLHQPMHVGSIYLDAAGKAVDPDQGSFDPKSDTEGGNALIFRSGGKMHSLWDSVPPRLNPAKAAVLARAAKKVPATKGKIETWPTAWAGETIQNAQWAFQGLTFEPKGKKWETTLPAGYAETMNVKKEEKIVKAGARLAQLLKAIWP